MRTIKFKKKLHFKNGKLEEEKKEDKANERTNTPKRLQTTFRSE